jgi:hypothetical protein
MAVLEAVDGAAFTATKQPASNSQPAGAAKHTWQARNNHEAAIDGIFFR